ncbi:MAG TPA: tetratricopeptide repeat protein [Pseudolabrys sp.]|nr:tetratricopeptide repeat protein [Pseudolabrys sp.]
MVSKRRKASSAGRRPDQEQAPGFDQTPKRFVSPLRIAVTSVAAGFIVVLSFGLFATRVPMFQVVQQTGQRAAEFVGSETCAGCHRVEAALWHHSQHKHAMDHATEQSVLGDFHDATFYYYGVRSRFFRKDGKYWVETDGPGGKLATFQVRYTFGVDPLQQYLIEFPDGRVQALSIAWDARPKEKGGQRWFHLYPGENIRHDDVLHWTKLNQNWNFMCAECHSTGLRKNYDAERDRYATTWREISVGCEACHGQGSNHVAWARARDSWWPFGQQDDRSKGLRVRFDERVGVTWTHDPASGYVRRNLPVNLLRTEVETCGRCHARRSELSEYWAPGRWLQETHAIGVPLARDVYWPDGQMRDVVEAYNYVPFKQSKMFAAGVTCSNCHDPHSSKQRIAGEGVCLQCHASEAYAGTKHSHHQQTDAKPDCVSCHMPARTYMVIDIRHDHSLRIPRPDLSVKLGTPNACNDCHTDKTAQWASDAVTRWFGPNRKGFQTYADAFAAAAGNRSDARQRLVSVAGDPTAPNVARGNALVGLAPYISSANADLARRSLTDPDPMVRIAAMDMLALVPATQVWPLVAPFLSDSVLGVRIRAVSLLAAVPVDRQPPADRERFEKAAAEFIATLKFNADRPEDRSTLANFYARQGRSAEAEIEYKAALRLSPQYAAAAINLADLYRQMNRDSDGETVLRSAIASSPHDAGLHHALGLTLNRLKRSDESLVELSRAAELDQGRARYAYVYAVGLHSTGRVTDAIAVLKAGLERHPTDRDTLLALVTFNRDNGDVAAALTYAERLARLDPDDRRISELIASLKRQLGSAPDQEK